MKPAKSFNTLANQPQQPSGNGQTHQLNPHAHSNNAPTSPICRCRVMYLGSSVPHITKDGLQGIQEPLRELYPDNGSLDQGNAGIDSWLSVWSNGILIENVDDTGREIKRFFKIEALHYCAAVKYVPHVTDEQSAPNILPKFLPLDSPHARTPAPNGQLHPPIFASILRRTTGVKVLECHAFICKREAAANALVRCCFHAYADTMYAKQISSEVDATANHGGGGQIPAITARKSKSIANLNDVDNNDTSGDYSDPSRSTQPLRQNQSNVATVARRKSSTRPQAAGEMSDTSHSSHGNPNLHRQQNLSKSMHQLNQVEIPYDRGNFADSDLSTSHHNLLNLSQPEQFHNPYAGRVPSYPPQSIIDQQTNNTGTLKSVKSMAAHSIASTLLRSKKHAKSMAQLNQQQHLINHHSERVTSFHQPQLLHPQSATIGPGSFMTLPPVPPMFLPSVAHLPQMNGSQTMKLPSRSQNLIQSPGTLVPHFNLETMTPKEMKKLLKKSAKYGIDPSKLTENGLPLLPPRLMPIPPMSIPMIPQPSSANKSGTFGTHSLYSLDTQHVNDTPDYSSHTLGYGAPPAALGLPPPPPPDFSGPPMQPVKSILVRPNPEFLKSKAGKKWLKQQKEFKKLLPPHLDGLPIVFGPPPMDALEPANGPLSSGNSGPSHPHPHPPPPIIHPTIPPPMLPPMSQMQQPSVSALPLMDSNGYYNPHPFYGPSGRASAASTLLRYSPTLNTKQQEQHQQLNDMNGQHDFDMMHHRVQSQALYSDPSLLINPQQHYSNQAVQSHNHPGAMFYGQPSHLRTFERQYPFNGDRTHRRRNHMVEQSVISLGDEAEGIDDDLDVVNDKSQSNGYHQRINYPRNGHSDRIGDECQIDGYYDQVQPASSSSSQQNGQERNKSRGVQQQVQEPLQVNYEESEQHQQQRFSDDQSGYSSSGIYRRKHLNERAFSHSIRQEHKSNGGSNSDADYSDSAYHQVQHQDPNNNRNLKYAHDQQQAYEDPRQIYQNRPQLLYANNNCDNQQHGQVAVEELSTRFKNQMKMKSYA